MRLIERYTYADYASLSDFQENYQVNVPSSFNFAYDVVDEYALYAGQQAMIWVTKPGEPHVHLRRHERYSDSGNVLLEGPAQGTRCCCF